MQMPALKLNKKEENKNPLAVRADNVSASLETPQLSAISPSIPLATGGHRPGVSPSDIGNTTSTADFVSKYLNLGVITESELKRANPFEAKFRQANLQIKKSGSAVQSPEQATTISGEGLETPTIGGIPASSSATAMGVLKLPPLSAHQSPSIFPGLSSQLAYNIVLSADGMQKSLNVIQQLRDATNNRSEEATNLATADVLKGVLEVLDGSSPNPLYSLPSSASLAASFASAAAAASQQHSGSNHFAVATAKPISSEMEFGTTNLPVEAPLAKKSQFEQFAASTASILQQHQSQQPSQSIVTPSRTASLISVGTLMGALQPSAVTSSSSPMKSHADMGGIALSVPSVVIETGSHSSPASTAISPRHASAVGIDPNESISMRKAASTADFAPSAAETSWSNTAASDIKPDISAESTPPPHNDIVAVRAGGKTHGHKDGHKPRKYTRYQTASNNGNDGQVTSSRGGRGRRPLTADMPPDERRHTILERNKAAAVRYRKRKKDEHDEMIGRVAELEDDKHKLSVQIQVLTRELRSMSEQMELITSKCVCRARHLAVGTLLAPSASDSQFSMGELGASGLFSNSSLSLPGSMLQRHQPQRPSSQHSIR